MSEDPILDRVKPIFGNKLFICKRCGSGPVSVNELDRKAAINRQALKMGISSDCNLAAVVKIQED